MSDVDVSPCGSIVFSFYQINKTACELFLETTGATRKVDSSSCWQLMVAVILRDFLS